MRVGVSVPEPKRSPLREALVLVPVWLAVLITAAHFLRHNGAGVAVAVAASLLLTLWRQAWVAQLFRFGLLGCTALWGWIAIDLTAQRQALGAPWLRMALIVGAVGVLCLVASMLFTAPSLKKRYVDGLRVAPFMAFALTLGILAVVILQVPRSMLLLGRFVQGGNWIEAMALATYAAWLTPKLLDVRQSSKWRKRVWLLFSIVFFSQLALALLGFERFQMTPEVLHLPIPALILAGPIYRHEGFFMLILFGSSVLLAGPAWCSHLCYVGAWDNYLAAKRKKPTALPRWRQPARIGIAVLVLGAAALLGALGVSSLIAGLAAIGFGLVGVGIMMTLSRKSGQMVHCVTVCPVGLAATWLGKISPFRLRINDSCSDCGACARLCRYDALDAEAIANRRPKSSCTLCGDCMRPCKDDAIEFRFLGLRPATARAAFVVIVVAFHAATLGLARV